MTRRTRRTGLQDRRSVVVALTDARTAMVHVSTVEPIGSKLDTVSGAVRHAIDDWMEAAFGDRTLLHDKSHTRYDEAMALRARLNEP